MANGLSGVPHQPGRKLGSWGVHRSLPSNYPGVSGNQGGNPLKISLEKGHTLLDLSIAQDKVIDVLKGKDVPVLDHDKIHDIINKGITQTAPADIRNKTVAVIIPDDTRLWARGDLFVPGIIHTLEKLGVPKSRIRVIIALGTHKDIPKEKFADLCGDLPGIKILNSASLDNTHRDSTRLVHIGTTDKGTPLTVTREAWEADHIIIFGGILHHMLAGFGGGRKYVLPGIAGETSINHNHSLAMGKDGIPHPLVCQAKLLGNPVNEDMMDGADLFLKDKTCCYAAVAANGHGDLFYAGAGPLHQTFNQGCRALNHACSVDLPRKGSFALFSAGGYRTDTQLYQATKALFNAVNAVEEEGKLLFVAACSQGIGNQTFASALEEFKDTPEKLGKNLTQKFSMPAYVALRVIDLMKRFSITLVSDLDETTTRSLGFGYTEDPQTYVDALVNRGYIIPFAENILPLKGL